ncbi:hypothetical protein DNU06_02135 [Putridiphycobacter roseus]|uniref:Thiamine phosphate synthase/TenI domain-containing protein n=1 Tax=Putridiphycobacter roseus TaxID=2219161 RepID=A0A2W1N4Y4_9FLAO|nr:hypothetical protein [Putridiphycobacter roseus]PZE18650.1 hypothetical protein DNU06_02135 [Putridiphycobacter roseus]
MESYHIYTFHQLEQFKVFIHTLSNLKTKNIWLKNTAVIKTNEYPAIKALIRTHELNIFIEENLSLAQSLEATGLLTHDAEKLTSLKAAMPTIKLGVIANDIADCKNAELFEADLVFLGPYEEIGLAPYLNLSPVKQDYEWMFLNIIIPLIPFGTINKIEEKELFEKCILGGIAK